MKICLAKRCLFPKKWCSHTKPHKRNIGCSFPCLFGLVLKCKEEVTKE